MADDQVEERGTIPIQAAAQLLRCSDQTIHNLVKRGYIPAPTTRGRFSLVGVVQGRLRDLEERLSGTTRTAAEDRVRDQRARAIELQNAQTDHKLIETEEAINLVDEIVGMMRTELDGLPARVSRDLKFRTQLEAEVDGTFSRVKDRLAERASALRSSGELADEEAEADA